LQKRINQNSNIPNGIRIESERFGNKVSLCAMKILNRQLFAEQQKKAGASPRKRAHFNLHESPGDSVQRLIIAMEPGAYIRPHKHPEPIIWESFYILSGSALLLLFSDEGEVKNRIAIEHGGPDYGVEFPTDEWHTIMATGLGTVLLELKPGPYTPLSEKYFASWAPREGNPNCQKYLEWFTSASIGSKPPSD
jgi:cupin fold WbuC family metalloprotein